MSADEKKIGRAIMEAVAILPDEKREYILGYAEGVIAMADAIRRGPEWVAPEQAQDSA